MRTIRRARTVLEKDYLTMPTTVHCVTEITVALPRAQTMALFTARASERGQEKGGTRGTRHLGAVTVPGRYHDRAC